MLHMTPVQETNKLNNKVIKHQRSGSRPTIPINYL